MHAVLWSDDLFDVFIFFVEYLQRMKMFVILDLNPNCLQNLSADDSSR